MTDPIDSGDVSFKLGNRDVTLKFTLDAARTLSRGGIIPRMTLCTQHDLDAMTEVIAVGTGEKITEELLKEVFVAGMKEIEQPLLSFLLNINRGGPAKEDDAKKPKAPQAKA